MGFVFSLNLKRRKRKDQQTLKRYFARVFKDVEERNIPNFNYYNKSFKYGRPMRNKAQYSKF